MQWDNYYNRSVLQEKKGGKSELYQGRLLRGLAVLAWSDAWGSYDADSSRRKMHVTSSMSMYFMLATVPPSGNKTLAQTSRYQ